MLSKYVASVIVADPDTHLTCEVEIRKLEDGTLLGLDGAWLEQADEETLLNPYDGHTSVEIPDNEQVTHVELGQYGGVLITEPMTIQQLKAEATEDGWIEGVIPVDLSTFTDNDLESLLDILSEQLTGSPLLSQISYHVVGHEGNTLHIRVEGDISLILDCEDGGNDAIPDVPGPSA